MASVAIGSCPLLDQPLAHPFADRDHGVGFAEVEVDQRPQCLDDEWILQSVELDRDLGKDVLADDHQRHAKATGSRVADVADHGRVGHAKDQVGALFGEDVPQRRGEIGRVVRRAEEELGAVVAGGADAHDLNSVAC
jgi:hypothetical protein